MRRTTGSLEVKAVDFGQRTIAAYVAAHNNIDRVHDVIDPRASEKAVARLTKPSDVAVFVGHDNHMLPVGVPTKIEAHPHGLYTETHVKPGPVGDDLLATARFLQQHGTPLGASIGYRTRDSRYEQTARGRVRRILDYDLHEYSFASPKVIANPLATVVDVKTRRKALGEGADAAGGFLVPPGRPGREKAAMQYRVEQRGGTWLVLCDADNDGDDDDDQIIGSYDSEQLANQVVTALRKRATAYGDDDDDAKAMTRTRRAAPHRMDEEEDEDDEEAEDEDEDGAASPDPAELTAADDEEDEEDDEPARAPRRKRSPMKAMVGRKAVWTTAYVNDLPDSAFLYVQSGGSRDETGRTVPRSNRHFPYKGKDGAVDLPHLRNAIARIPQSNAPGLDDAKKKRLQARARLLLERASGQDGKTLSLGAQEWKTGAPLAVRALGYALLDASEDLAAELAAMRRLGDETKGGARMRAPMRARLAGIERDLRYLIEGAARADRNEDGKARVAWLSKQVALLGI
jgi:HK97 family phage prohead protease